MTQQEDEVIDGVASRHEISSDAVRTILRALRASGGSMAQFSHEDFGGMSQWSPGMTMVGDMFDDSLKSKLGAVCCELAAFVVQNPDSTDGGKDDAVSYRAGASSPNWWPAGLGTPGAVGAQNDLRYAVFPGSSRLAIEDGGRLDVYDTADHQIHGVAQSQSSERTLAFTSQNGLVRISDLKKIDIS